MERDTNGRFAKAKQYGLYVGMVALFIAGFMVHDRATAAFNLAQEMFFPAPKPYVAEKTPHEIAFDADYNDPTHVEECRAASEQRVYFKEAAALTAQAQNAFANSAKAELKANRNVDYESVFINPTAAAAGKSIRDANKSMKATTSKN